VTAKDAHGGAQTALEGVSKVAAQWEKALEGLPRSGTREFQRPSAAEGAHRSYASKTPARARGRARDGAMGLPYSAIAS